MGQETIYDFVIVNNHSLTSSFTTAAVSTRIYDKINIFIDCTGTPVGSVIVQSSNNFNPNVPESRTDWVDFPFDPPMVALTGGPQTYDIDIIDTSRPYIRIKYVAASGVGSMYAVLGTKEV